MRNRHLTLAPLIMLLLGTGMHGAEPRPPAASSLSGEDAEYSRLADEFTTGYLAWRPLPATQLGVHDWDGRITDLSPASIQREIGRLREYETKLAALSPASLSTHNDFDRRILLSAIRGELFWLADARSFSRDPRRYVPDISVYIIQSFAPLEQRLKHVIAIENELGDALAAARANLDERLPRPVVETAIRDARGAADFLAKDAVEAFKDVADGSLQAALRASAQEAAGRLRAYAAYLESQKLPKADDHYALGRERYQRMLRNDLISLPVEEILELGMRELRREQQRFADAARAADPGRKPVEAFREMLREHPTAENLVADTRQSLEAIRRFVIDHDLVTVPSDVRVMVRETPSFMRSQSAAMMFAPGPLERKATEAVYYVTPVEATWTPQEKEEWLTQFNRYTSDSTSIHEAYPGHYVQGLHMQAAPLSRVEAVFSDYAFVEGWAHYAEQMVLDAGFQADGDAVTAAKYRMAQSNDALLRLCRLCVSIRMHCQGMNVDEATRFFQDNAYLEEKPARAEAVRGTFDPEYLYYTLGKLQLLKLRDDYRRQEGPSFSPRRFHDAVLDNGAPPIRLLREVLLKDKAVWDQMLP